MYTNETETECEAGPQKAPMYLSSLLYAAMFHARRENERAPTPINELAAQVLYVLCFRPSEAEADDTLRRVAALGADDHQALVGRCKYCVWQAHYKREADRKKGRARWRTSPPNGHRLLEKLFL